MTEKNENNIPEYEFKVHKIQLKNAIEVAYVDEGNEDSPVLLFLHGFGGGIPIWTKNISHLRSHFRCIAIDLPGHGFSQRGDFSYTMAFYLEVVIDFINSLGIKNIILA